MNLAKAFRDRHPGANVVKRARNAIHVETAPGKFACEIHLKPIHFGPNADQEIDTQWQPDSGVYQHQMALADYKAQAKAAFNGAPLVRYEHVASGQWVTLQPRQLDYSNDRNDVQMISAVQGVTATVDDDVLLWTGAYGAGRDFKWQASTDGLAKELILQTAAAAPTPSAQVLGGANPIMRLAYTFAYSSGVTPFIDGVEWSPNQTVTTAGAIEFRAANGDVLWRFAVPQVTDASGNVAPGVVQRLSRSGPNLLCEVRVPYAWLASAAYPVSIDPTLTLQPDETAGEDTYIQESTATTNYGTANIVALGRFQTVTYYHSLLKFDLSSIPAGSTILSSRLRLMLKGDAADNTETHSVFRMKQAWEEAEATWNIWSTGNNWQTAGGDGANDREQTAIGSLELSATETLNVFKDWSLDAAAIQEMLDGGVFANNGFMVRANRTVTHSNYTAYSSTETTANRRPIFEAEYTEAAAGGGAQKFFMYYARLRK